MRIKEIEKKCDEHNLEFKQGHFKDGKRYKVVLSNGVKKPICWPCKNLKECSEAIFQANYLRERELVPSAAA